MPSSTEPTPRPWAWEAIGPGEGDIALGGAVDPVGEFHILTPHVCESCSQRGASCLAPNTADAELIVEAVNNYDRLKKIEAAAQTLYHRLERASGGGPMQDDIEALGEALEIE